MSPSRRLILKKKSNDALPVSEVARGRQGSASDRCLPPTRSASPSTSRHGPSGSGGGGGGEGGGGPVEAAAAPAARPRAGPRPLAVLVLTDKRGGEVFDEADEAYLIGFCHEVEGVLRRKAVEAMLMKRAVCERRRRAAAGAALGGTGLPGGGGAGGPGYKPKSRRSSYDLQGGGSGGGGHGGAHLSLALAGHDRVESAIVAQFTERSALQLQAGASSSGLLRTASAHRAGPSPPRGALAGALGGGGGGGGDEGAGHEGGGRGGSPPLGDRKLKPKGGGGPPPPLRLLRAGAEDLAKWDLDVFKLATPEMAALAGEMFHQLGLVSKYRIDEEVLSNFIHSVFDNYRPNPFHNCYHAFSVLHMTFLMIKNGADEYLAPLDLLSALIGSFCHDIDHPGNNNVFEVNAMTDLALAHGDDAVLERHHAHRAFQVLLAEGNNVLRELQARDAAGFRATRRRVVAVILGTDMSRHAAHVDLLAARAQRLNHPHPGAHPGAAGGAGGPHAHHHPHHRAGPAAAAAAAAAAGRRPRPRPRLSTPGPLPEAAAAAAAAAAHHGRSASACSPELRDKPAPGPGPPPGGSGGEDERPLSPRALPHQFTPVPKAHKSSSPGHRQLALAGRLRLETVAAAADAAGRVDAASSWRRPAQSLPNTARGEGGVAETPMTSTARIQWSQSPKNLRTPSIESKEVVEIIMNGENDTSTSTVLPSRSPSPELSSSSHRIIGSRRFSSFSPVQLKVESGPKQPAKRLSTGSPGEASAGSAGAAGAGAGGGGGGGGGTPAAAAAAAAAAAPRPPFDRADAEDRLRLLAGVVHCADLTGQALPRALALEWGRRVLAEFQAQAEKEDRLGLPLTFARGSTELELVKGQIFFIEKILDPLFQALVAIFPRCKAFTKNLRDNQRYYAHESKRLQQKEEDIKAGTRSPIRSQQDAAPSIELDDYGNDTDSFSASSRISSLSPANMSSLSPNNNNRFSLPSSPTKQHQRNSR